SSFFFDDPVPHCDLHSFPTRRSSDLRDVTGWKMGPVVGIAYEAKRDGKTKQYFHEFKKKARPDLVAKDDGSQLYIDGGKYMDGPDRKSTRLNSSHVSISYAVFCLKKK